MATRADIRDAFYDELVSAATQTHTVTYGDGTTDTITVDESAIELINPNPVESRPAIIYDEDYTRRQYNGVGEAPHEITRDSNGDVTSELWREYLTATFQLRIQANSEIEKEPIYEAVRSAFAKYAFGPWHTSDLHPDISDVRVEDGTSTDYGDEDRTIRVDDLLVEFDWHRTYDLTSDTIDVVDLTSADDETYTIN